MPPLFNRLAIIGVGLIGGSAALALKQSGQAGRILGIGRRPEELQEALRLGVVDEIATDLEAVCDADVVLLATPVGQFSAIMQAIAPHLKASAVVTDAGSTKGDVVAAVYANMGAHPGQFVPGHPIAGAEKSGVAAARAELFTSKNVVLTPLPENSAEAVDKVEALWRACGANVCRMTPQAHDAIFAAVSHLPHLLAFALVAEIAGRANAEQLFGFCAGGFRDFTRIAGSSPEMWRDISLANRDALLAELNAYQAQLTGLATLLENNDAQGLEDVFARAKTARNRWLIKS